MQTGKKNLTKNENPFLFKYPTTATSSLSARSSFALLTMETMPLFHDLRSVAVTTSIFSDLRSVLDNNDDNDDASPPMRVDLLRYYPHLEDP